MVYKRKTNRRPYRRPPPGLATRPRMFNRTQRFKRMNQVSTQVMWFKENTEIAVGASGTNYTQYVTNLVEINPQFIVASQLWDQYKVLGMKIRLFPANVGTEPDAAIFANNAFLRGNHIVWSDQRYDPTIQSPSQISDVINTASAKMMNPRRQYSRAIYRPRGKVSWGSTRDIANNPDPWKAMIGHFCQDTTPLAAPPAVNPILFFVTIQFKVIYRGRSQDT